MSAAYRPDRRTARRLRRATASTVSLRGRRARGTDVASEIPRASPRGTAAENCSWPGSPAPTPCRSRRSRPASPRASRRAPRDGRGALNSSGAMNSASSRLYPMNVMLPRTSIVLYGLTYFRYPAPSVKPPPEYAFCQNACECTWPVRNEFDRRRTYCSAFPGSAGVNAAAFSSCCCSMTASRDAGSCAPAIDARPVSARPRARAKNERCAGKCLISPP